MVDARIRGYLAYLSYDLIYLELQELYGSRLCVERVESFCWFCGLHDAMGLVYWGVKGLDLLPIEMTCSKRVLPGNLILKLMVKEPQR